MNFVQSSNKPQADDPSTAADQNVIGPLPQAKTAKITDFRQVPAVQNAWQRLTERTKYIDPTGQTQISQAFVVAGDAHRDQARHSGEPYITHPLSVAAIVADWGIDVDTICAAILHDVIEDTELSHADLAEAFNPTVADLVNGVSKLSKLEKDNLSDHEAQAANIRKLLMATVHDLRVVLIKLADRLHNMRSLRVLPLKKRQRIARETLDVYAPIAYRLGLSRIFRSLEDLSFSYLYPNRYKILKRAINRAYGNRKQRINQITESLEHQLGQFNLSNFTLKGREKSIYSVYRKMRSEHLSFIQVLDLYGCRILVPEVSDCYLALGAVHALYKPAPGKFKDYIALPKDNGYQSLHTTVLGPQGQPLELQIRTHEMHRIAEDGIASHWTYKSKNAAEVKTSEWCQSLLELHELAGNSTEFLEQAKNDLSSNTVLVFSPKGHIFTLQRGSTVVDFAYSVHTRVGGACIGAIVNQINVRLDYELKNGDKIEIITGPQSNPSPEWLSFVRTSRARSRIRHALKNTEKDHAIKYGRAQLERTLEKCDSHWERIREQDWHRVLNKYDSLEGLLLEIAIGKVLPIAIVAQLLDQQITTSTQNDRPHIVIHGNDSLKAIQLGQCCHPIPGDKAYGLASKNSLSISVHSSDCFRLRQARVTQPQSLIAVLWETSAQSTFQSRILIGSENKPGVLASVARVTSEESANIEKITMEESSEGRATMLFTVRVKNRDHLARVLKKIRQINMVRHIKRVREH